MGCADRNPGPGIVNDMSVEDANQYILPDVVKRRWDQDEIGYSNSSELYKAVKGEIGRLIREDAYVLLRGGSEHTGGLILAQLAHQWGFEPTAKTYAKLEEMKASENASVNRGNS